MRRSTCVAIEELESRLKRDSRNSSKPPSSDAPWSKRRRGRKPPSDRKPGAHPGHAGKSRPPVDPADLDETTDHCPEQCDTCGHRDLEHDAADPNRHQVAVLPRVLWPKTSFGSQAARGLRFAERALTATATLRRRGERVFDFLADSIAAHVAGTEPPVLVQLPVGR